MKSVTLIALLFSLGTCFAEEAKPSYNFQSCKVAEAYRLEYESMKVMNPESFYSCDPRPDTLEDYLSKPVDKMTLDDYEKRLKTETSPAELSDQDLLQIRAYALQKKYPSVFENFSSNNIGTIAVYKGSLKKVGSDILTFWYFLSYHKPRLSSQMFLANSQKFQLALNCKMGTFAYLQGTEYSSKDESSSGSQTISVGLSKASFEDVPPNTLEQYFYQNFCNPKKSISPTKEKKQ